MSETNSTLTSFTLNGKAETFSPIAGERLSEMLRERSGCRDVKIGCNAGDCGACSVLLDGDVVCACLTPAQQVEGRTVETLSGLHSYDIIAQDLAESFLNHGAAQCGICTPGMIVSAVALLHENKAPNEENVKDALGGVLCRCTGYRKIIDAVLDITHPAPAEDSGYIGQSIRRLDGQRKVSGLDIFGDDVAPSGTEEIFVIRSPYPTATFTLGDLEQYINNNSSISTILTAKDIPGENTFGVIPDFQDQPVFAEAQTRFRGEAVAAIVAKPEFIRDFDPETFPIIWNEKNAVQSVEAAQASEAPLLHKERSNNQLCGGFVQCGDAERSLKDADFTVEGRFQSGFVEHGYIEPEAGFAEVINGRIEVHACTQAPVMDLEALEIILGMDQSQIRIVPTSVGGGFGSKLDISVQPILALATLKTGKPVRLTYSRTESMQSTTKRHPSDITLKIGANADGKIQGFDFLGLFDTGAYASWGPTVANRVPVHASGPYKISDYRAVSKGIHTNNPPSGAFRGFGVPQSAIAQESLFDVLAKKIGMDALEFRILNALENNQPTVCGQVFSQGVGIKKCLEALRSAWNEQHTLAKRFNTKNDVLKRGAGLASGWYGCGNTSLPNPSTIKCGIRKDGTVVLHQGAMDIGQGANTVIAQVFATALGISVSKIELVGADTDITPDAGKTSASRQTFVSGNAARLSGEALRASILQHLNGGVNSKLKFGKGMIEAKDQETVHILDLSRLDADDAGYVLRAEETYDPPTLPLDENGQGSPYAQFGYAAQMVIVEVDTELGTVKPLKFIAAHDVGRAINPVLVEGQIHGGIAQGMGMALMEEYIPGRTENLHDYLIPTVGDIPPIDTIIIEEPDAHGPYGAKGLGEHVLVPTAPAILNAIYNATGARITKVPATPSRVLGAIKVIHDG
ncbi:molybdopterin cofactor-binding domain-containing protein [Lentilitoribacter sp. Alg239-R112]|uniref:molybdopterin-dependent oxidoreductase n=1 Tax=Lentilitoribacter sp. Alg239-R112 TaxID=2305987 RepID=UPI0013A6FAF9|nr:molybdopterin cofactor-binding domain-containing protein [Lentilitoribacter sp. Alg239-R112]